MIKFTEQQQNNIINQVKEGYQNFFNNLNNYRYGYGVCSLDKIIPADIPAIIITGGLSETEIAGIQSATGKSVIFALGDALGKLTTTGIKPDFIVLDRTFSCAQMDLEKCEVFRTVPVITSTDADSDFMRWHMGPVFFIWAGNILESQLWYESVMASAAIYHYNKPINMGEKEYAIDIAVQSACYMGVSHILLTGEFGALHMETRPDICIQSVSAENNVDGQPLKMWIEKECTITYQLPSILAKLIPMFDDDGRKHLADSLRSMQVQGEQICVISRNSRNLYEQLYMFAQRETVLKSELEMLITALNKNTAEMENIAYFSLFMKVSEQIKVDPPYTGMDCFNEIAQICEEGLFSLYRLELIIRVLLEYMTCQKWEDESVGRPVIQEQGHIPDILLMQGISQYDVLPIFIDQLKRGFQEKGWHTYVGLGVCSDKDYSFLQETTGYDYVFVMNGMYMDYTYFDKAVNLERYYFDNANTQLISYFVDHPQTHIQRFRKTRKYMDIFLPDGKWLEYIQTYMPEIKNISFLPLGGIVQGEHIPFTEKENRLVFFGSTRNLQEIYGEIQKNKNSEFINEVIYFLQNQPDVTVEEAIRSVAQEKRAVHTGEILLLYSDVFALVDEYIRQYYRQQVIETIAEAGIPMDIYGWKMPEIFAGLDNVRLKEPVSMEKMLETCRHTRFVVNIQPWTKDGSQERVFNTMLGGSVIITDESQYLKKQFNDEEHLLFYRLNELDELPEKIGYYIDHPQEAERIAVNGFQLASERHTWKNRVEELIRSLEKERR